MRAGAVIPAKCFEQGKSRLAGAFAGNERASFARSLLAHVLGVASECDAIAGVLVATDCTCGCVAELARARGAVLLPDRPSAPLSLVVDGALAELTARECAAAIVLMSDLPRLCAGDLTGLVALLDQYDVVIVPDENEQGTNALALAPPSRMPTSFGTGASFARHQLTAERARLRTKIHRTPGLAFDVDAPSDLKRL